MLRYRRGKLGSKGGAAPPRQPPTLNVACAGSGPPTVRSQPPARSNGSGRDHSRSGGRDRASGHGEDKLPGLLSARLTHGEGDGALCPLGRIRPCTFVSTVAAMSNGRERSTGDWPGVTKFALCRRAPGQDSYPGAALLRAAHRCLDDMASRDAREEASRTLGEGGTAGAGVPPFTPDFPAFAARSSTVQQDGRKRRSCSPVRL